MDYSVGSLADLISGSNTPNKTKVVRKEFKKEKRNTLKINNKSAKIKKPFKTSIVESTTPGLHKNKDKSIKKKSKKQKPEQNNISGKDPIQLNQKHTINKAKLNFTEEDNFDTKNIKREIKSEEDQKSEITKKIRKRKLSATNSKVDFISDENSSQDGKILNQTEEKTGQKVNKRNLDRSNSENNLADNEQPLPKRTKLSYNARNAERRVVSKFKEQERVEDPETLSRTIFVGNIPIETTKKKIKQHFKIYGQIETIRIRGIPVADPNTPKKVAAIKKEFNPKRSTVYCFIRFENEEAALNAEVENGVLFEDHHLRVHCCKLKEKPDESKAIFVGNLSFEAEEDELWKLFEPCGPISYVRIVRDSSTGMGKGFGFINFKDSDAVQLALEMENVKLRERELRIKLCNHKVSKKNNYIKNKKIAQPGKPKLRKMTENSSDKEASASSQGKVKEDRGYQRTKFSNKKKITQPGKLKLRKMTENDSDKGASAGNQGKVKEDTGYQGTKFSDKKKKHKVNKGLLKKKRMMKKIAPKVRIENE